MTRRIKPGSELLSLANIGPAALHDLERCGITTIAQLKKQDATKLYRQICAVTRQRHDPCVWDVFAAAIHEAKTGQKTKWWEWTKQRKLLKLDSGSTS